MRIDGLTLEDDLWSQSQAKGNNAGNGLTEERSELLNPRQRGETEMAGNSRLRLLYGFELSQLAYPVPLNQNSPCCCIVLNI